MSTQRFLCPREGCSGATRIVKPTNFENGSMTYQRRCNACEATFLTVESVVHGSINVPIHGKATVRMVTNYENKK